MTAEFPSRARFRILTKPGRSPEEHIRPNEICVVAQPVITRSTKFFGIGSCFALEIRGKLREAAYDTYPKYLDIPVDPVRQFAGGLPRRDGINHYDTFVIRQEIERAVARRRTDETAFWPRRRHRLFRQLGWRSGYQDPGRRHTYATDIPSLLELSHRIDGCIDVGLAASDVVIITLGLTECWRNREGGRYVCMGPRDENDEICPRVEFHPSTFAENYENVRATVEAIWGAFPEKKIMLTVSPVALARTWTDEDVVVANMHSKTTLCAVAHEICQAYPAIIYWPSFEFALVEDIFAEDGRHVRLEAVDYIVTSFLEAFRSDG